MAEQDVEDPRWYTSIPVDLIQLEPGPGSVFGGLVHHGVPRDQRCRRHACRQGEGEVERSDTREYAVRTKHVGVPFRRCYPSHWPHEALRVFDLLSVVIDQVRRFLRIAHGL